MMLALVSFMPPSHGAEDYEAFVALGWTDRMTHNIDEDSSFSSGFHFLLEPKCMIKKEKRVRLMAL